MICEIFRTVGESGPSHRGDRLDYIPQLPFTPASGCFGGLLLAQVERESKETIAFKYGGADQRRYAAAVLAVTAKCFGGTGPDFSRRRTASIFA